MPRLPLLLLALLLASCASRQPTSWSDEGPMPVDPTSLPGATEGWGVMALIITIGVPGAILLAELRPGWVRSKLEAFRHRNDRAAVTVALRGDQAVRVRIYAGDTRFDLFPGDPPKAVNLRRGPTDLQVSPIAGHDGPILAWTVDQPITVEVAADGGAWTRVGDGWVPIGAA